MAEGRERGQESPILPGKSKVAETPISSSRLWVLIEGEVTMGLVQSLRDKRMFPTDQRCQIEVTVEGGKG